MCHDKTWYVNNLYCVVNNKFIFLTIKPAAEKILSVGTDVDETAIYRRARTESLEYLSELFFHHARESITGI
jgi:hypothetical protein